MDIISKTYIERTARDIDAIYVGNMAESLTLYDEDELTITPEELTITLHSEGRSGVVHLLTRNLCWYSVHARQVQQEVPKPVPSTTP